MFTYRKSEKRGRVYASEDPMTRFLRKVQKQEGGCWLWTGGCDLKGYGRFAITKDQPEPSHRVSMKLFRPDVGIAGLYVCHTCDNPPCVNPDHLFVGSPRDNTTDMQRKWRTRTKLTPEQVESIRLDSRPLRVIAAEHGLKSHKSVANIKCGRTFSG